MLNYDLISWDQQEMGDLLVESNRSAVMRRLRPHTVLHLAWASTKIDDYQDNPSNENWGEESSAFMRECTDRGIRFLAMGSAADQPGDQTFDSPYSAAKRRFRLTFEELNESSEVTWLRPQYVVSLEDKRPRVVRAFLEANEASKFRPENPDTVLDFIHVADVCSGIKLAIQNNLTGIVELGSGNLHSVAELITAVDRWSSPADSTSKNLTKKRYWFEGSGVLAQLGWRPSSTQELFAHQPK